MAQINKILPFCIAIIVFFVLMLFYSFNNYTLSSYMGFTNSESKKYFWELGIDCYETFKADGYESIESIIKMFSLGPKSFTELNPRSRLSVKAGDLFCVRGKVGIPAWKKHWPSLIIVGLFLTGASIAVHKYFIKNSSSKVAKTTTLV